MHRSARSLPAEGFLHEPLLGRSSFDAGASAASAGPSRSSQGKRGAPMFCRPHVCTVQHDTSCCMLRTSSAATCCNGTSADANCHKAASFSGPSSSRALMPKAPSDTSALPLTMPARNASSDGDGAGAAWLKKGFTLCSTAIDVTLACFIALDRKTLAGHKTSPLSMALRRITENVRDSWSLRSGSSHANSQDINAQVAPCALPDFVPV